MASLYFSWKSLINVGTVNTRSEKWSIQINELILCEKFSFQNKLKKKKHQEVKTSRFSEFRMVEQFIIQTYRVYYLNPVKSKKEKDMMGKTFYVIEFSDFKQRWRPTIWLTFV